MGGLHNASGRESYLYMTVTIESHNGDYGGGDCGVDLRE